MARPAVGWRHRLDVAVRIAAAGAGGYLLAALVAVAAAWTLPLAPVEAATAGTMLGLLAWPVAAMACCWARSAARAWAGTALTAALLAGIAAAGGWRP